MSFATFDEDESASDLAEINMVPLIDVMLVLLVIFIVAAPMLQHAVKLDLPRASAQPLAAPAKNVQLSIDAASRLWWDGASITPDELPARLAAAAAQEPLPELHLRAERSTPYEKVAEVMAAAGRAGLTRIGFVTDPRAAARREGLR